MNKTDFVHLHVHTHYSLLDGLAKPGELVERAKELGMPAIAITDHGAMYGAIEFYQCAQKAQIKPIIGMETYVAPRSHTDKASKLDANPYHLTLWAKDAEGYRNLMRLTSIAHLEGFYYKPRVDKKMLKKYSKGILAGSGCLAGEAARHILSKDFDSAKKAVQEYEEIFGKGNYYLELQHHPDIKDQQIANEGLKKLAAETSTPLVVTCDTHYLKKEDREAHDVLVCVQTGKTVEDPTRMIYEGDFSLKDPQDLAVAFKDVPEALENTKKIADQCNLEIKFGENLLPSFPLPKGVNDNQYLREMCEKGLKERYAKATADESKLLHERLDYELSVIEKMGFASYFLIVADYVKWSKENSIMVGPGRGSAAGALVAYLTYITDVDPIKYGLLFERFLNPDRIEMPDIDLDFADHRRAEVLSHIVEKYGDKRVAGIITYGTMAARAAVRDTGRALGMPYTEVDAIAKIIPPPVQGRHLPLEKSVVDSAELREVYQKDPRAKRLLDMAMKLEGTVRHASQHASAFVITKEELTNYVPLQLAQKEGVKQITQYSMYPVADLGLLKMDFLGLANLTTIERALEIIEAVHPVKTPSKAGVNGASSQKIDIYNLPLDDTKTFQLLGRAETTGVFQLESSGMKRYVRELKPTSIDDVAVMVALYRPGPMQFIDSFIARKNGKEKISYPHEMTKTALEVTYGIPVYQEQVMQISKDMAGFTGGEADKLRKAMGKKIAKLMAEMKTKFIVGAMKKGVTEKEAENVFSKLEDFAAYGFNKSHAVCYAMIAYQTAYLKAHHPECFMAALMTSDLNDIDRIAIEIAECERMGIKVMPPDVNESFVDFGVVKESGNIRFGLGAIKNIGEVPARIIVRERKKNGPFKSFEDFIDRMSKSDVEGVPSTALSQKGSGQVGTSGRSVLNKKILEALAMSGALDQMAERRQVLDGMETILKRIQETNKEKKSSQIGLFGEVLSADIELGKLDLPAARLAAKQEKLAWEKELLGIYLSEHPLREYGGALELASSHQLGKIHGEMEGGRVKVGGIITTVRKINTRNGQPMLFVGIEDLSGKCELIIFPKLLTETQELWSSDNIVLVSGKVSTKDNEIKILADKAERFDPEKMKSVPSAHIVTVGTDEDEIVEIDLNVPIENRGSSTDSVGKEPEVYPEYGRGAVTIQEVLKEKFEAGELVFSAQGARLPARQGSASGGDQDDEIYVVLPHGTTKDKLMKLKDIFENNLGQRPVVLAHKKDGHFELARTKVKATMSKELIEQVEEAL